MSEIRFARSGEIDVAYRVVGDGPIDLVYVSGAYTHLEIMWELPQYRRYCERLGEFARLITFDKRGMGMSDRVPGATTLEERMDDIRAVMDASGSGRAAVMGESEGGPLAILFAAAHPERTISLVLQGAEVRERTDDEWPWGEATEEEFEEYAVSIPEAWGKGRGMSFLAPSVGDAPWAREWLGRLALNASTPASWEAFARMAFGIDVRDVVPSIKVPTLDRPRRGRSGLPCRERALSRAHDPGSAIRRATGRRPCALVRPGLGPLWPRSESSSPGLREAKRRPIECSRPSSSPTSSARPPAPRSSATGAGATLVEQPSMQPSGGSSRASTGARWTLRETGSSRRSTDRRGRFAARGRSSSPFARSGMDVRARPPYGRGPR